MSALAQDLQSLIVAAGDIQNSSYTAAASIAIMLYDWFLTLDSIDLIWKKKHTFVTYVYLLNRYLPFTYIVIAIPLLRFHGNLSTTVCKFAINVETLCTWIGNMASMWLLFLRVTALYNGHRKIVWSVYVMYFSCHIAIGVAITIGLIRIAPDIQYLSSIQVCISSKLIIINYLYSVVLLMEFYVFGLLVFHHYRHRREDDGNLLHDHTVLGTIRRNGYFYFLLAITVKMVDWLMFLVARPSMWWLFGIIDPVLSSVVVCRFTLQLRSVGSPKVHMWKASDDTELDSFSFPSTPMESSMNPRIQQFRAFQKAVFSRDINSNSHPSSQSQLDSHSRSNEEVAEDVIDEMFEFERADTRMDV